MRHDITAEDDVAARLRERAQASARKGHPAFDIAIARLEAAVRRGR